MRAVVPSAEIRPLTSLRGVAAMAVVLQHFSATFQLHSAGWMPSLVPHGYMAVDFFFVLSGFIMSYTYLAAFEARGMAAYGPFLAKRVARIAPLGLFVTALVLLLGGLAALWGRADLFIPPPVMGAGLGAAVLVNVLHLQGVLPRYNLNGPSWSISVELIAYLLFPALIALLMRGRAVMAAVCLAAAAALVWAVSTRRLGDFVSTAAGFSLLRCVVEFSFGMLAFRTYRAGYGAVLGRDRWTWAVSLVSAAALLLRQDGLAALSFPFLVLAWAFNTGRARQVLSARPVHFLGVVSFSIYLIHQLFRGPELALVQYLWPSPVPPVVACLFALAGSLSVIPVAALVYATVERPGRTAIKALLARARRPSLVRARAA